MNERTEPQRMSKRPRKSRALGEPVRPEFLVDLHATIDSAVARNKATVVAAHYYDGWEAGHETVNGWRTQIALLADPGKVMEVWYDNLDHDVFVSGDVEYQEWTWESGDETAQRECLNEVDQLVDVFARRRLPQSGPHPS
ncbi:hypothetical protein [Arthrobacter sp. QXT-31]|uniref:hypothetical protein n=1 Tax=Arthrobacter sp. QXT-31 TaxID=1357915 RepID=UPI0012FC8487|nr:hypothetical protein [Arthrobacter sp. QXT-31]